MIGHLQAAMKRARGESAAFFDKCSIESILIVGVVVVVVALFVHITRVYLRAKYAPSRDKKHLS